MSAVELLSQATLTMTKREYRRAVADARRVIGFVTISDNRLGGVRISKRQALFLINAVPDDKPIFAEWGDAPDNTFLFVGTKGDRHD